ncbi:MAG: DUF3592 domain-containing protein [Pseudomonadota bacterium]
MPVFTYEATDPNGVSITAETTADDAVAAADKLRAQGLTVSKITQKSGDTAAPSIKIRDILESVASPEQGADIGRPPDRPIMCGWCETKYPPTYTESNCSNCGGPLPLPPGPDRGPVPPAPPRHIPPSFSRKLRLGFVFVFGLVFVALGVVLAPQSSGFTLVFSLAGALLLRSNWRKASNRINALKDGIAAEGEILSVGFDESVKVNGKHPYLVRYRWDHEGRFREGQKSTWDEAAMDHYRGEPIWVVYTPDDTRRSAIWPPMA